ncbi:MAG: hypothetical protein IJ890_06690 [Clostridia bacterium]|nr:hypothetical protein [Clostridia bacterium]
MKKVLAFTLAFGILIASGSYAVKIANESAKAKEYEERTGTSAENKQYAKNYAESEILGILYEKYPNLSPLAEEIRISKICGVNDKDEIWFDYFVKSSAESSESYDGYYYEFKHECVNMSQITDNDEVITWFKNNL